MTGQVLPVPNPQLIYPHSSCVKPHVKSQDEQDDGTPEAVYLHPQSKVFFDVLDKQRSEPLPLPDLDTLRIPTLTAFLDSIIGLILDPSPRGPRDNLDRMMWELWITVLYKGCKQLRRQKWWKENHKLRPQTLEVMRKLRPENQPYFAAFTETGFEGRPYDGHIKTRQALLSTLGSVTLSEIK
ncbi:hypothetical protein DXG01_014885 [Tephrocybe rancida]|nr:hypothetical protein DXG01_014885 [Tephrocybe rancida]